MKAFDLEKALAGEPVRLRNGNKAIIYGRIPEGLKWPSNMNVAYPLIGVVLNEADKIKLISMRWHIDGGAWNDETTSSHDLDIIGMWEDDIATIIERAAKENLPVKLRDGTKAWIVAVLPPERFQGSYLVMGYGNVKNYSWTMEGCFHRNTVSPFDIVGLWENE